MKLFKLSLMLLSSLAISSCTSTKKVQEHLNYNKQSITYLMDSPPSIKNSGQRVSITSIKIDTSVRNEALAIKETGWIVPLLAVNVWESRKMCYLGASMFENDWTTALQDNLLRESNRSGVFNIDSIASDYQLEFSIDKLEAKGPYYSQGFYVFLVAFYFYSFGDYAGPAETELAISYVLKKNGKSVREKTFKFEKKTEQLKKGYKNKKELIQGFATSMAEATSNNFKNAMASIVLDLNDYFEGEVN
jgi:hypothetical protein